LDENTKAAAFQPSVWSIITFAAAIVDALVVEEEVVWGMPDLGSAFLSVVGVSL